MQEQAKQFIALLESQQLLSPEIVEELHRQVSESKTRLTPELLAKLLVDNGHLTKFQATKLIAEIKTSDDDDSEQTPAPEVDELGLAPSAEEGIGADVSQAASEPVAAASNVAAVILDDDEPTDVEVVDVVAVDAVPVQAVEAVEAVEVVEAVSSDAELDSNADSSTSAPTPAPKPVRKQAAKANPWDSFRILGVGLILLLLIVAGYFLINHFARGNADERLKKANDLYEQRSYESAANLYREFTESFPAHEQVSYATVRSALSTLRDDSEGAPNPSVGLSTAMEVLPGIADEPGLPDQQSDLAGALIALATKFTERADRTKEMTERKQLMTELDQLMELINNPQYVGANQRSQQAPTLQRLAEDRQRILREINRDEELEVALGQIDEKLGAQDTMGAYDIRSELINRYPLLEANPRLQDRVRQASQIQQSLVSTGSLNPQRSQSAPATAVGRSFILGNRSGPGAPSLQGQVAFVKVKGSVYGLEADTGNILWRHYVGQEFHSDPIRLGETSAVDALVCQPEKGLLSRLDGRTGETKWHVDFGRPIHMPAAESEDLFVSSMDGQVASLDLESGQTKWVKQLPQPVQVRPGLAFRKPNLYLPAEHSNLYVLSRSDGSCREVYYLGHRRGAVVVPPVLLLGQLFVFENSNSETSKIRVLATDNDGLQLKDVQTLPPLDGNIVVEPQANGRRLAVQTDLGQIQVLDVEPTVETDKVSVLAGIPKNVLQPQLSWSAFVDSQLWVADRRFTLFDLQISLGKLNRTWTENDGDQFAGPPQYFEDVIIHTRRLRGNRGSRVAAVNANTGQELWETDLGVPISLISSTQDGKFDAVNTGGAYFRLDNQPLRSEADANPGQGRVATLFTHPVSLAAGDQVMLNESKPNQLAYLAHQADRSSLSVLSANFGSAKPSCPPIAVEDNLAVGLNNGQFILIDPTNGALAASPYQPPMQPGKKVVWNRPVYLDSSQTLIVASDLQKLVRLSVGDSLRALTEVDLEAPLTGPLALLGTQVVAVSETRSGDRLVLYDSTSLEQTTDVVLDGHVIGGPFSLPELVVVQTEGQLIAVTSQGEVTWSIDFPSSELTSPPVVHQGQLVMATTSGEVWVVDAATGDVVGNSRVGQGLSSAPVVLPVGLLLGSDEGAVLALPMPSSRSETP